MDLTCIERPSDSPYIEAIWRSPTVTDGGAFISMAEIHCGMVITTFQDKSVLTVRGPEIRATPAYSPEGASFVGIVFKPGVYLPTFPAKMLKDRQDVNLPQAGSKSFWLQGSAWEFPNFENADTFINRLIHEDLLEYDPIVDEVLREEPVAMSLRNTQRRFAHATGLTRSLLHQIERARYATTLLKQGVSILDTVQMAGYYDQPHLTRALRRFIGQTPYQLVSQHRTERLSFLYKTPLPLLNMIQMFDDQQEEYEREYNYRPVYSG